MSSISHVLGLRPRRSWCTALGALRGAPYVREAAFHLNRAGLHALRLNCRGGGLGRGLANSHYHAGLGQDIDLVVRSLLLRPEVRDVSLFGFSLGGHMCLKLLGTWGSEAPRGVRGAVTISAPRRSDACGQHRLERSSRRVRAEHREDPARQRTRTEGSIAGCAADLKATLGQHRADLGDRRPRPHTAVGFSRQRGLLRQESASHTIEDVSVPTLAFHAEDDPVVPFVSVERHLSRAPNIEVSLERSGGHVGFSGAYREPRPAQHSKLCCGARRIVFAVARLSSTGFTVQLAFAAAMVRTWMLRS